MKNETAKNDSAPVQPAIKGKLKFIGGSKSDNFNNVVANQALQAQWFPSDASEEERQRIRHQVVEFMALNKPADELEGMILAQMMATHAAAMECYRRAMIADQPSEGRSMNLNFATKATRTFTTQLEALQRYRGKGSEQRVTVQHQHINVAADQAIVGINTVPAGGDGAASKPKDQPHALGYAPGTPVRSADPERVPMPVARSQK
jgi:hypothetical protein